jgi:hypothetical protein
VLTKVLGWFQYPVTSEGNTLDWFGGLVLILVAAFLWTLVLRHIVD